MTGVDQIILNSRRVTLLGGWNPELGVYVFWDPRRHIDFTPGSPSLQVRLGTLEDAVRSGLATEIREVEHGHEVIVAITSDALAWYVQHGRLLHDVRDQAIYVPQLVEATMQEEDAIIDAAESDIPRSRRYELIQLMRPYRDARFRRNVLEAYRCRCAICGCSLRLVDAAHIIPVSEPDGTDAVSNGIALCRLHHGAYDNALLGVLPDYRVALNEAEANHLREAELAHGLQAFRANLPEMITLPAVFANRPIPVNLRRGLELRQWPHELIT